MSIPSAEEQLRFLGGIQRILDEGSFVATYKYALLMALADYAVQSVPVDGSDPEWISTDDLAENFIISYWRQAVPYATSKAAGASLLRMSSGNQPVVFSQIVELRDAYNGSLNSLRRNDSDWRRLKRHVANTIANMPLWKLQVVGGKPYAYFIAKKGRGIKVSRFNCCRGCYIICAIIMI